MKTAIILRGIPGAGKSTWIARNGFKDAVICSADHFYMDTAGRYNFNPAKLGEAHAQSLRRYVEALQRGVWAVVSDNTGIHVAEVAPYCALALAYGYDLRVVTLRVPAGVGAARNVHGVPRASVERMALELDAETARLPRFWPHEIA